MMVVAGSPDIVCAHTLLRRDINVVEAESERQSKRPQFWHVSTPCRARLMHQTVTNVLSFAVFFSSTHDVHIVSRPLQSCHGTPPREHASPRPPSPAKHALTILPLQNTPCWLVCFLRKTLKVADLGILGVSRGAPSLTCLDLAGCTGVTDAGVAHLSSMVVGGKLECLRLDGLVGLSDDGLDALLLGDGDGLEAAAAAAAPAASAARAAAARAAAARASSSSSDGGDASPAGAEEEAPASSSLRVLSLSRCPGVTDQGLARLGASRPLRASLRELDVSGTSTTESGLLRLLDPSSAAAASGEAGGGGAVVGRRTPAPLKLESLVLQHGGGGITGVGLSALVGLTSLTRLDLEGCRGPGVTSQALAGE